MVSKGRCAGCGVVGPVRAVERHVAICAEFSGVYKLNKAAALDPAPEFQRWLKDEGSPETKQDTKTARVTAIFERRDDAARKYSDRWATPVDPLA